MTLWTALEDGIADIWMFNCGRRPHATEREIMAMVLNRFKWINA